MAAPRLLPLACAGGLIALAVAGPAAQGAAAGDPASPHSGHGQAVEAKADGPACPNVPLPRQSSPDATSGASVADLARLLHGTWVRRLTIGGAPIETNSFWYFDMSSPQAGRGQALMIDRVNQGWDALGSIAGTAVRPSEEEAPAGAELEAAATTGAYWSVSITPAPAAGRGQEGVILSLAGDYRGTAERPDGFRFTETGTFYRDGTGYATHAPWRAPPMAVSTAGAAPAYTPVDAVVVDLDRSGGPMLTFIVCQDEIVDRYYKVNSATPTVEGKSLKAAWESALASGMFKADSSP